MISNSQREEKEEKMPTKRQSNDFINFIIDAEKNPKLADEFLSKKTAKHLHSFFHKKGYKDIPYNHCQDILTARDRMRRRRIPREGEKAVDNSCVGHSYEY
jgi:hypothetical protein